MATLFDCRKRLFSYLLLVFLPLVNVPLIVSPQNLTIQISKMDGGFGNKERVMTLIGNCELEEHQH